MLLTMRSRVYQVLPFLLLGIVMWPRISSAQFGLLDDGVVIDLSRRVIAGDVWQAIRFETVSGRFHPVRFFVYSIFYLLAQDSPTRWFWVNLATLAGMVFLLMLIVQKYTRDPVQASITAVIFILSTPVIENFYTLSKEEPLQVLFLLLSIVFLLQLRTTDRLRKQLLSIVAILFLTIVAMLTKETSVTMVFISFGWLVAGWAWRQKYKDAFLETRDRLVYLLASLVGCAVLLTLRFFLIPQDITATHNYSQIYSFESGALLTAIKGYAIILLQNFLYLIPMTIFVGFYGLQDSGERKLLLVDMLIWMFGWIAIFLPWHTVQVYYLLPFTVGCAVLGGIMTRRVLSALLYTHQKRTQVIAGVCLAVSVLLLAISSLAVLTSARIQLTVDRVNSELLDFLAVLPRQTLVLVDLPRENEYVFEMAFHLALFKNRQDIRVDYYEPSHFSGTDGPVYVLSPWIENRPYPSVRVAVDELSLRESAKDSQPQQELVSSIEHQARVFYVRPDRIICQLVWIEKCSQLDSPFESRDMVYGWRIFKIGR